MKASKHPLPFVLAATDHGSLIVNRNDYRMIDEKRGYGVGFQLLNYGRLDPQEVAFVLALLRRKRQHAGDGVVALDCGANIGVHTVEWAREMHGWGRVYAFEAQEKIYYALAGNVVLNNCLNVTARHCAVGARCGSLAVPEPDYCRPGSYGSLELVRRDKTEFIGQPIDYSVTHDIPLLSIDSLSL
jgi:FkbM family methyltransferase